MSIYNTSDYEISCEASSSGGKRVLILASYTVDNHWEEEVLRGITQKLNHDYVIKVEFLDSRSINYDLYDESLLNLLNIKYESNIDCIMAIDDEAFQFARKNLFNKDSFMYKKPIIFCGVNEYFELTSEECDYINGILGYQDNTEMINLILKENRKVEDIHLLIDNSIYCDMIKEDIEGLQGYTVKDFNLITTRNTYLQDLIEELSIDDEKKN